MPQVFHEKRRQLTADELELARREIVDGLSKIQDIEAEKKEAVRGFTERISPIKSNVNKLMLQVRTGLDIGGAWCEVVVDPVTRTVKFIRRTPKIDPDTGVSYNEDEVFDEKTFDEVGESQLSLWSEEDAEDGRYDIIDRMGDVEFHRLRRVLANSKAMRGASNTHTFLIALMKPWPARAADIWLVVVGAPCSTISLALTASRLGDAMQMLAAGYSLIAASDVADDFHQAMNEYMADECDVAQAFEEIANNYTASEGPSEDDDSDTSEDDDEDED